MPEFQQTYQVIDVYPDGTVRPSLRITLTPEENEKAKAGYFCWHCGEDWTNTDIPAWPGTCPVCATELTIEQYGQLFTGPAVSGSQIDWADENERLDRQAHTPRTGIWVPGD